MSLLSILINLMWITNKAIHFLKKGSITPHMKDVKQQNDAVSQVNTFSHKIYVSWLL